MAGKKQFDEFLGGTEKLPSDVHIMKLVSSRASEIAAMTYSIENPEQTKLVFQKLPVHMRRRVMSHNAKRLPRRLREAHLNQMTKSGLPPKSKRPSRRYRRRPRNLLSEYNRRQRTKVWLETHIWHAKRFHMVEKWGYRIASYANDRCFKANYRAVANHCLMQDISYYTCIEINGPEDVLKETLKPHCNPYELTFAAKIYTTGTREGTLMFFKRNSYPLFPIGYVHFLWKPSRSNLRTIWIWVHPSFLDDFLNEIKTSFKFEPDTPEKARSTDKLSTHSSSYSNNANCKLNVLKDELNRFRFYGPLTINVLTTALQLPNSNEKFCSNVPSTSVRNFQPKTVEQDGDQRNSSKFGINSEKDISETSNLWHVEYYSKQEHVESLKMQEQLWQVLKTLESPSQLPPNIVLGFTVLDPRFYLPDKRTKSQRTACSAEIMPVPPTNANCTPLWETEIRQKVKKTCVTSSAINKLRSDCLVPGISNDKYFNEDVMAKIPILLIQRTGNGSTGSSSGIDVILPAGWAMPFWIAFLFRCVKVGALRESMTIPFQYGNTRSLDINDPDTAAYAKEALTVKQELIEKYFRYPPNRRVNFTKVGISSPFFCEWKILMREWTNSEDFFVLRNRDLLSQLQRNISSKTFNRGKSNQDMDLDIENAFECQNCLVRVKISILKKGCPRNLAIICLPKPEDLQKFANNSSWSGPVEKLNSDSNEAIRKTLRKNHLAQLKRLKRQRIRHRKSLVDKLNAMLNENLCTLHQKKESKNLVSLNQKMIHEQSQKMSQLYLPTCRNVRYSCDREVMGYVTVGDFSFVDGKGVGLGYVTLNSLLDLIANKFNIVLVRNTQTRQYRIAKFEILI